MCENPNFTNPMIEQGGEAGVPRPVADGGAPGEALDPGREVSVGEDVCEAEVREVHLGELREEDLLRVVALGAEVEQDAHLLRVEVELAKVGRSVKVEGFSQN